MESTSVILGRKKRRGNTTESSFLLLLLISLWFAPRIALAQTGEISGRVVTEDGVGLPNMIVFLRPARISAQTTSAATENRSFSDEDGNFKFIGLTDNLYSIGVPNVKGYVRKPDSPDQRQNPVTYRPGARVTITMIKGGAITGRVTNSEGDPLIGMQVSAVMTRDAEGQRIGLSGSGRQRYTDDRGVYRIYGLVPGKYIVYTRANAASPLPTPYDGDVSTYHPSSTRDTAVEVTVQSGGEAGGIDIRHLGARGHVISGVVTGADGESTPSAVSVSLHNISTGAVVGTSFVSPGGAGKGFAFYGLPDDEYLLVARTTGDESGFASQLRRVSLKRADVTGVELKLAPLASISGRIVIENLTEVCAGVRKVSLEEFSPMAVRDDELKNDLALLPWRDFSSLRANEKGEFAIQGIDPGHYRIGARLPGDSYFLKSITAPVNIPNRRAIPSTIPNTDNVVSREGVTLKQGEKLIGLSLVVADGAASLQGRIAPENSKTRSSVRFRAHLIPVEPGAENHTLRYVETIIRSDGSFAFSNLAPGKYRIVARAIPDEESVDRPPTPLAWNANERSRLQSEARVLNNEIELKPCDRVKDLVLRLSR